MSTTLARSAITASDDRGAALRREGLNRPPRHVSFALPLPDLTHPPPVDAPPPPDPALLDAVRADGEADGHARGLAEGVAEGMRRQAAAQEAAMAASLAAIAAAFDAAAERGRHEAAEAAEALATVLLAAMDAALPLEAARCGEVLIARVAQELRPAIADRPEATLHVAPELVARLSARLPEGPPVAADPAVPPGDARIAWRDGACLVALDQRRGAVREALHAAGFNLGDA
jgi:flagellar biosynthesis/type III secretory pathway protein FliH